MINYTLTKSDVASNISVQLISNSKFHTEITQEEFLKILAALNTILTYTEGGTECVELMTLINKLDGIK